jgi:hypothetical protein
MTMTNSMTIYFSPKQREVLSNLALHAGLSEPEYIRQFIVNQSANEFDPVKPDLNRLSPVKLGITLPGFMFDAIEERAKSREMAKSRYVCQLLQSHLTEVPVFPDTELSELIKCNDHLWKIGININQLAHHLNATLEPFNPAEYDDFMALKKELPLLRRSIRGVIRAARGVWGVKNK